MPANFAASSDAEPSTSTNDTFRHRFTLNSPRMFKSDPFDPLTAVPSATTTPDANTSIDDILKLAGLTVSEEATLPGRAARYGSVPDGLHPAVHGYLKAAAPGGLYSHQALALTKFLAGEDLCLGTSTASGKSLIFGAAAAHVRLNQPGKVLACYPLRALVQDQEYKWQALAKALGLKVGVIHGGVATAERLGVLEGSDILLVTPDVIHSYLLGALPKTMAALAQVRMVILDELASYNGVFASNAAYLFRRLAVHLGTVRWITATATIGNPIEFGRQITSRNLTFIGPEEDGSPAEPRRVLLLKEHRPGTIALLKALSKSYAGTVLAFADARKGSEDICRQITENGPDAGRPFLPFRAGFEDVDRSKVQQALASGELCGLISTSALEVGVDLPDVGVVILLNVPPSVQAGLQRIGRIRGVQGTVLVFDSDKLISRMGLEQFLARPAEPNTCYIANPFVMYANALCAARELEQTGPTIEALKPIPGWGEGFLQMVANELNPTAPVPENLFPLKQRVATRSPHLEFPLRGTMELTFQVSLDGNPDHRLGTLSNSQRLREAGPGMIYGYLGRSFRVVGSKDSTIFVRPEQNRFVRTTANILTMAFPQWTSCKAWSEAEPGGGLVAVTNLQISERCVGFSEKTGKHTTTIVYGPGSPFSQRPILRVFPTTGVAFGLGQPLPEAVGEFILKAYAQMEGIHARDLGTGPAQAKTGPLGGGEFRGLAIFDAACTGGLDLTRKLAENFLTYVEEAARLAELEGPSAANVCDLLKQFAARMPGFRPATTNGAAVVSNPVPATDGWITGLIAPGESGLLDNNEVTVLDLTCAREGIKYRLQHASPTVRWLVPMAAVQPLPGSKKCRYHPDTGEVLLDE
jgi:DEAD/DEAH box helicase domain-containing protein